MIGGVLKPGGGLIAFEGRDITGRPAHVRARQGITRVFQRNALFHRMTVLENVLAGSHLHARHGFLEIFYKRPPVLRDETALQDRAMDILRFVGLESQADRIAVALTRQSTASLHGRGFGCRPQAVAARRATDRHEC